MIKMLIATAAGFLMVPAAAYAGDTAPIHFTANGVDYAYTVQTKGDTRILRGSAYGGMEPFELRVTKTSVTGTFDGKDVYFSQRQIAHSALPGLASR